MNFEESRHIVSLIDLTSLNDKDTEADITALCQKAITPYGHVAAVCVYPKFVKQVKKILAGTTIRVATVANFPNGIDLIDNVVLAIQQSIAEGAEEIDVVFPYTDYLAGKIDESCDFIQQCKTACGPRIVLKVILETGALIDSQLIGSASRDALLAGADFIKTSTGKIAVGATLSAATIMLTTIKNKMPELNRPLGFKASGGIRTIQQAREYIALANQIMGPGWVVPQTFRLGTSQLINEILRC